MNRLLSIIKYVLLALGLLAVLSLTFMGESESVDLMLRWAYIMLGLSVAVVVILPLMNLAKNPQGALRSLIGLGLMVIVLGISYAIASPEPVMDSTGEYFTNPTEIRLSDMGLYATYITLGAAFIITVVGEIINSFK